jgi:hypothetical protein
MGKRDKIAKQAMSSLPPIFSMPPSQELRWYQLSLRSLIIVVTLFAVLCSWFAVKCLFKLSPRAV